MKLAVAILGILLGGCSFAQAQSSGAGGSTSNGSTIRGTGGAPGSNASSAQNHRTAGNGATQTTPGAGPSSGNAVDTPVAKAAEQNLESTNTGILKK
jgi:hypothetical protein